MARWNIAKRLFVGVGSLVLLLVISGVVSFGTGRWLKAQLDGVTRRTAKQLDISLRLQHDQAALSNLQRGLLLAALGGDQAGVVDVRREIASTRSSMATRLTDIKALLADQDARRTVGDLENSLRDWDATEQDVEKFVAAGAAADAWDVARRRSAPILQQLSTGTGRLAAMQDREFAAAVSEGDLVYRVMLWLTLGVLGLSVLAAIAAGRSIRGIVATLRRATHDLATGAEHVASASAQVASASQSMSQGATQQAASLEETSASMEEMASMTRTNAENTRQTAAMMAETERQVRGANGALTAMVASMSAIKDSSDKVSRIIKTIDEIAFQTNILALTAAVEAARAGEAGMGFAVVADEVRTLAQRSAQAAKDTAALIEESISKAGEGNVRVTEVTAAMGAITASVEKAKGLVDEVSTASDQQSQGIEQVSHAIAQMEKVTQNNAGSAEESAAVSVELRNEAERTTAIVTELMALVGTDGSQSSAGVASAAGTDFRSDSAGRSTVRVMKPRTHRGFPELAEDDTDAATGTYGRM